MIEKNNKDPENLIKEHEKSEKNEIRNLDFNNKNNDEMKLVKNEKNEYLDFRGSFSVLKKFLQNQNIIFLCEKYKNDI